MQNSVANPAAVKYPSVVHLGTRTSQLALWQTNHVVAELQRHWPQLQCELIHHVTQGDKRLDRPLPEIGGKGLFTAELEEALRQGEIDLAVHSLKDLPVEYPADLLIGAILSREDTRDVLVAREGWTLTTLPLGAIVGTSSLRRQAQLLATRPDLDVRSIRGNVDTRLRKVLTGEYHAAVMAGAGLSRLGLTEHITQWIAPDVMLSAPGQGALAVQCRADDTAIQALLAAIHDADAAATTTAERHLLFRLGGGCSAPIGAWAQIRHGQIDLRARIASVDGRRVFDASGVGSDPYALAVDVAESLVSQGAQRALRREIAADAPTLAGKRVVVTRPPGASASGAAELPEGDFAAQLQRLGAETIVVPAIQLVPAQDLSALHDSLAQLDKYDWVVFTSPNAVAFFWSQAMARKEPLQWATIKIAAVGSATQHALQAHGLHVDAVPKKFLGTEIVAALGNVTGQRILLPRSGQGGRELPVALREQGALVDDIALYSPVPAPIDEAARTTLAHGVDVVTFASGSAVRAFADALRDDARFTDFWSKVVVACIGPTTAEVARSIGLSVHVVAEEHNAAGLAAALVTYYHPGA